MSSSYIHRGFSKFHKKSLLSACHFSQTNIKGVSHVHFHDLPKQARVVICGAGAIGNSVAYHLVQRGWTDVVVLEQGRIGGGVTWRGTGLVGHFHSAAEGKITQYSANLYRTLKENGYDTGWQTCGALNVARTKERMILLKRMTSEIRSQGLECEVLSPKELSDMFPLIRTEDLEGGVWVPADGYVNPLSVCQVLAQLAQNGGAKYFEKCQIQKILVEGDHVYGVQTDHGVINCEYVALCTGMWSKELGQSTVPKFKMPIQAAERFHAVTNPIPGLSPVVPIVRDYDGPIYFLQHKDSLIVGGFRFPVKPVFFKDIPKPFEFQEFPGNYDHFRPLYEEAKRRLPILANVDIQKYVNGPDTFTPDVRWILGETPEIDKLYVAVGSNGNPVQAAGGLGKALADWMVSGEPHAQLLPFDIRRFIGNHDNRKFLRERVQETVGRYYAISHPLMVEFNTARPQRCSPLYSVQEEAGAVFGERMGFERALYFDPTKSKEEQWKDLSPTFGQPPWFECVREEYNACRERVGIIDMSSFTKIQLQSAGREVVDFMQMMCCNDVDVPVGHIIHTGMQNERGGYENDCMLLRQTDNSYFMVSPTAQQTRIREWLERHLPEDGSVSLNDVTSMYTVLNVVGPKSKELMKNLTHTDMRLPPYTCKKMNVGYASDVLVMSFNNTGEPGYSLYVPSEYALHVYGRLMSVGQDFGVKNVGYYTLRFLRIEKFIPFWGEELDSNTTPYEVGRGYKVKLQKDFFLGKFALQVQLEKGLRRRLVHFQLEKHNPESELWPWGREPILRNGKYCGMTTSSGFGFTLGKAVVQGFIKNINSTTGDADIITNDYIMRDATYEIDIAGKLYPAKPSVHPPNIPIVRMMGLDTDYIPKARTSAVASNLS